MNLDTLPESDGIKVLIGTRTWIDPTWTHVDIDSTPLHARDGTWHPVDVVCDARHITLPSDYADLVFSSECLEHFPRKEYQSVLAEWVRILKPGGMIRVEVPDFLAACNQVLEADTLEMDRAIQQIIFAEQLNQWDFHFVGLTPRMLTEDFENLNCEVIDIKRGPEWGWLKVDAVKK